MADLPADLERCLERLAALTVMLDETASPEDWAEALQACEMLQQGFAEEERHHAADAAAKLADLAQALYTGSAPDPAAAIHRLQELVEQLQDCLVRGRDPSVLREETARAGLFLHDLEDSRDPVSEPPVEEEFLQEIAGRVEALETLLFGLEPPVSDPEIARAVFREFHTLKGESGIVGLTELSRFWHHAESAIERARGGGLVLTRPILDALLELAQAGRSLLLNGLRSVAAERIQELQRRLTEAVAFPAGAGTAGDEVVRTAADLASVPAEAVLVDASLDVSDAFSSSLELAASPPAALPAAEAVATAEGESDVEAAAGSVALGVDTLDRLLEAVGDVALLGSGLAQRQDLVRQPDVSAQMQELNRSCRSLQSLLAELRMTQVRPLFLRARRAVFEASRSLARPVDVVLEGEQTRVDRQVLEQLNVALVHLSRNAVDHGIEDAQTRREAGKPERGRIRLHARRSESDVLISFSDDGRGIDRKRLREKAEALGLIEAGAELDDRHLLDLVFHPGLSTARTVSGLSGRGVGMNIVREAAHKLRGTVEIQSNVGVGTTVSLRLPLALTAVEGLQVRVGETDLVIPVSSVREMFRLNADRVGSVTGRGVVVQIRGVVVPALFLGDELGLPRRARSADESVLVLIEEGQRLCGVLVDQVLETRQVVIRPLEGRLQKLRSVTGAALLPDRRVALVVETRGLVERYGISATDTLAEAGQRQARSERAVETVGIGANQVGMVDFAVGVGDQERSFAINAFKVREFVRPDRPLTRLPRAPEGLSGVLLLRDRTVPVVSLNRLLGIPESESSENSIVMICEFAGRTVGFGVRRVNRVSYISWDRIEPPPETGGRFRTDCVVGSILRQHLQSDGAVRGDDVVFVLDYERLVQQALSLYSDRSLGTVASGGGRRVLLVEDSSLIRAQMKKALTEAGLEVTEAADGREALDRIEEWLTRAEEESCGIFRYVDLVLSDIEMPRMDGYTLTASLKKHPRLRVLPVILHSSITNDTMVSRAREVGADGFVAKCDHETLVAQLRKHL